ncbi:hypothetical protein KR054_006155, partial [Drosophila jambulina]
SLAVNSSVSDTTGFNPAFLVQGRDEVTPGRGRAAIPPEERSQQLRNIFKVARDNAERATAEQGRHYNLRRRDWPPALGSQLLVRRHILFNAAEGFAAKLAAKYDGPYRVVKFLSPNIVRLQEAQSRRRRTASINSLKPYHHGGTEDHDEGHETTHRA